MANKRAILVAGAALLGGIAWLPLTSAALHVALPWTTPPSVSGPAPAYYYWRDYRDRPAIARWLPPCALGSGLVVLTPALLAFCMPIRRRLRPAKLGDRTPEPERALSDAHGSAAWMSHGEALRWFPGPSADHGGVVVGQLGAGGNAPLLVDPCDSDATHGLVIASTGAGKTAGVVVPTLNPAVGWRGSVVVFDPSCRVGPLTRGWREAAGQRVVTLGFELDGNDRPVPAQGLNVLDWIDPSDPLAEAHVQTIIDTIGPEEAATSNENAIFRISGRDMQACLLADLLWNPVVPRRDKTLKQFVARMVTPEADMRRLLQDVHEGSHSPLARSLAGTLMAINPKTFSSIYANAQSDVSWLKIGAYADLVSGDAMRTDDLADGNMTVYVQIPMATLQNPKSSGVGRTVINALLQGVYRREGKMAGRVLFLLDEMDLLGRMSALAVARDTGRKYGVTLIPMWQSLGQVSTTWGEGGKASWLDGSAWQMFAAVNHKQTAEEVSERCGSYTILARTEGTSSNSGGATSGSNRGRSFGVSEQSRRLIRADEIQTRLGTYERIVFRSGGASGPLRCDAALWFRRPDMWPERKTA
jgi:type IV secretion system protein VirD4